MTLVDTTSVVGGTGQIISDWELGDDREFTGTIVGLPVSDPSFTDVYFTLKQNPTDLDSNAIAQKHITQILTPAGQITALVGNFVVLLVHIYAADYQVLVNAGTQYYWDFRGITTNGATITIAQGFVEFGQNVTQTNASGNPANQPVLPRNGVPQFRGFISAIPTSIFGYKGPDNPGDWYRVLIPVSGQPTEFVCTVGGVPGVWLATSIIAPLLGVFKSGTVTFPSAATFNVVFASAAPDATYKVSVSPNWLTSYRITNKTVNGFTVDFGVGSPAGGAFDWIVLE